MMAFDRTPSLPTLDPATVDALRTALARSVQQGNHDADDLRGLLCRTADEARAKGITAERLLVILKDLWHDLPEVANARTEQANALLQELISRCIHEYYSL